MKTLAIYNIKGGVGKTAAAINLGYVSSRNGYRTVIWDLDPQSSSTFYLRVRPKVKGGSKGILKRPGKLDSLIRETDFEGLHLLPGDFSYRKFDILLHDSRKPESKLRRIFGELRADYDLVLLDCAPGASLLMESIFSLIDAILIPTIPTTLSLETLRQLSRRLKKLKISKIPIIPFFSLVDRRKKLHRTICQERELSGLSFLRTQIPYASVVEQMGTQRAPLGAFAPRSPASQAFDKLWEEIFERMRK